MAERFDLAGSGVVVTGGASGIGAALACSFAGRGARVVVSDLDGEGAARVADEVGGTAVTTDVSDAVAVTDLVERARALLGEVDLFCANAGVAVGGGVEGSGAAMPTDWTRALDVNVMAHVWAAQALLPGWLERRRGHFLSTVSAAGVLTMLGSAPYAVSKHGALAFAEWLRATYDHRGITVQALCPMGVRTPLLEGAGALGRVLLEPGAVGVETVTASVLDALDDGRFLVLPHPEVAQHEQARAADRDAWLDGMNRLQRKLESPPPP